MEGIDTLVVGGGQAGIAVSAHLRRRAIPHLVLERARVAERWRSERWDSLVANGPAWHDRFPSAAFEGIDGDAFATREQMVAYFADHARRIGAPVREGVAVTRLAPCAGGWRAETSAGAFEARDVVVATGPFQVPVIPPLVPEGADVAQLHSRDYRNPGALAPGGVLVIGAGSSGAQIADELSRAGRRMFLSVGPHDRPPRRYRGRDYCWWLGVLGKWGATAPDPATAHVTISVSGMRGGETVDFRRLAAQGVTLLGMAEGWADGTMTFADDLAANVAAGDANLASVLDEADAYAEANGLDLPADEAARERLPDPACLTEPIRSLDLAAEGIGTVLWATGYRTDFSWIDAPEVFDAEGRPMHERGVSVALGLHFLGLPWLSCRGSSFIWGVWPDAEHLAERIAGRAAA